MVCDPCSCFLLLCILIVQLYQAFGPRNAGMPLGTAPDEVSMTRPDTPTSDGPRSFMRDMHISQEEMDKSEQCMEGCKVNKWIDTDRKRTGGSLDWWMTCQRACQKGADPKAWEPSTSDRRRQCYDELGGLETTSKADLKTCMRRKKKARGGIGPISP